jgi:hypothetical protein
MHMNIVIKHGNCGVGYILTYIYIYMYIYYSQNIIIYLDYVKFICEADSGVVHKLNVLTILVENLSFTASN